MVKQQKAQLNYLNITPRKVRLIANTIRGLSVSEAEAQLMLRPQRAAAKLLKLLRSGIANAKNNAGMNAEALMVSKIWVDPAPTLKRSLPRSQGRATPILKRMAHVTLILTETEKPKTSRFVIAIKEKKTKTEKPARSKRDKKAMPTGRQAGDIQPKPELKDKDKEPREAASRKSNERGGFRRFFRRKSI